MSKSERTDLNLSSTSLSFKMQGKLFVLRCLIFSIIRWDNKNTVLGRLSKQSEQQEREASNRVMAINNNDPNVIFL